MATLLPPLPLLNQHRPPHYHHSSYPHHNKSYSSNLDYHHHITSISIIIHNSTIHNSNKPSSIPISIHIHHHQSFIIIIINLIISNNINRHITSIKIIIKIIR